MKNYQEQTFYGRRQGRPLSAAKQEALDALLHQCSIDDDFQNLPSLLPTHNSKLILEIGFGYGERLAEQIRREPHNFYIGIEPFINGMAAFAQDLNEAPDNLIVYMNDAMPLVRNLPDKSINDIYILNPDPWHKTRHHKRRIIGPDNIPEFARILKPGGALITSTDVPYLAEWMTSHLVMSPHFTWTAKSKDDWQIPPKGWIHTRYETKGAKGAQKQRTFIFKRNT